MSFFQRLFIGTNLTFGNIELDARISENFNLSNVITDHPIDTGAIVSDNAYNNPEIYTLEGAVSDAPMSLVAAVKQIGRNIKSLIGSGTAPVSGSLLGGDSGDPPASKRSAAAFNSLLVLWRDRIVFDVQTGYGLWENLMIQNLTASIDKETANMLRFTVTLKKINRVSIEILPNENLRSGATAESGSSVVTEGIKQGTPPQADTTDSATRLFK